MNNIPTMTKNLLVVNVLAFIATFVFERSGIDLTRLLGLHFFLASEFHIYQFITYMFLHGGFTHILFNMFALWMFGSVIERVWGSKKFLFYYICCGVGAGFTQERLNQVTQELTNATIDPEDLTSVYGLYNVNKKLKLYYGDKTDGLVIKSEYSKGSTISFTIPCISRGQDV